MKNDKAQAASNRRNEQGFMLLGLIVAIALILIALSVAASQVAFSLRREREAESARRANQFVRAIQLYYRKFGHYPGSIEQLEKTNNVRYLRQRYVDPLTGKADYRLIIVGQNQTTVKGFFGEPLAGIATTGLGAAAGMQSSGFGAATEASGAAGTNGATGTNGAAGANGATNSSGSTGSFGSSSGFAGQSGLGSIAGVGSQSATGFSGSTGPFMGVGSSATGNSILVVNEQTTYQTWEFLYDPRIEQLKIAAALNGGADALGGGALGQSPSSFGQPPSSFGQSPGGFGQSPSGTGQSPSAPGGTGPTPTTQP
jgi:type II secretory pathway pseudopilin PulG